MTSNLSFGQIAGLGALGGLMSFGGNLASSAINSGRAWKYTRLAMQYQDELNRAYYQWTGEHGPTFQRKGFVDAGYNPLLALGSPSSAQGAIYSGSGVNSDSDSGSQAVDAMNNSALAVQNMQNLGAQKENIQADTDVKKYGQKGAILKNLLSLANSNKNNPTVQKIVDSQIVRLEPSLGSSAVTANFFRNHPTTADVIRKIKQGDFRGAKYAIDMRRKRILKELNQPHSALDDLKKINDIKAPSPDEIKKRPVIHRVNKYDKVLNLPDIT